MKSNIQYTIATKEEELLQILDLQQRNLIASISESEKRTEGFVTVEHSLELLQKMNDQQPHIIARDGDNVIGYALSMVKDFANDIPVLRPLFKKIDTLIPETRSYVVMGQICIDTSCRKQGVFRGLYQHMSKELSSRYDLLITEVDSDNIRSLHAHYAVGFTSLLVYQSDGKEWNIIQWDWA